MSAHLNGTDVVDISSVKMAADACNTQYVVFVKAHNKLYCKWAVQNFGRCAEGCIQVYNAGVQANKVCHVGYLPHQMLKKGKSSRKYFDRM